MSNIVSGLTISTFLTCIAFCPAHAEDAAQYCARVRNDDKTKNITSDLIPFARKKFSGSDDVFLKESTFFRCMDGNVWVCNVGANLPCYGPDRSKGTPEITAYCRENPKSDFIPMAVTGHSTIYSWKCSRGKPVRTPLKLDARGFHTDIWYRVL
jgi:hypothetical protein